MSKNKLTKRQQDMVDETGIPKSTWKDMKRSSHTYGWDDLEDSLRKQKKAKMEMQDKLMGLNKKGKK